MCIVQPQRGQGKPAKSDEPVDGSSGPCPRATARRARKGRPPENQGDMEPERRHAALLLATRRLKSPDGVETLPALAGKPSPDVDRRATYRQAAIILTARERDTLRTQLGRVLKCGMGFVELRRGETVPLGVKESRLVVQAMCHNRMCPPCDARRRAAEAVRLEGSWKTFWTMGVPASVFSAGRAWRKISQWVGRFFRELRRAFRSGEPAADFKMARSERRRIERENEEREKGRPAPYLQYAWCLEPHESGYPHVHWVTNLSRINANWVKALWSRIIRARVRWAVVKRVKTVDGVCRYLAKYQSKAVFTADIAAMLFRKRTWATTTKRPKKEKSEWARFVPEKGESLFQQTSKASEWAAAFEWSVVGSDPGKYGLWQRTFSVEEWSEYNDQKFQRMSKWKRVGELYDDEYDSFLEEIELRRSRGARDKALQENAHKQRGRALVARPGGSERSVQAWCERGVACEECLTLARILC